MPCQNHVIYVRTVSAPDMVLEAHQPKLHQYLSNLLTAGVLGLDVGVEFPLTIWVPGNRIISGPPQILVGAPGWRGEGVCPNERGLFSSDNLTAHHIQPAKVRQLYAPALRLVPDNHTHFPMCVAVRRHDILQAHHIVFHPVETIHLVGDIGIRHNN